MRRASVLLLLAASLALAYPTADSFTSRPLDTPSCGGSGCHGNPATAVAITLSGPDALLTNQVAEYTATITGGPSRRFGYYVLVYEDNRSVDLISGEPLFAVHPRFNVTGTDGSFSFNFTAPRYETVVEINVSAVSANADGGAGGDAWNYAVKRVRVAFPREGASPAAVGFALGIAAAVAVSFALYRAVRGRGP